MIRITEAKEKLKAITKKLPTEKVKLENALGKILANDVLSPMDVPPFDNSAMDGYAILLDNKIEQYTITKNIKAGNTKIVKIKAGEAARIFTGAPIPAVADTVVQQEMVQRMDEKIQIISDTITKGEHIRLRGSQCMKGNVIINKDTKITPGTVGLLSSVGITEVSVYREPKVSVIITGDELVQPGKKLRAGEIYNSNQYAITAYLQLLGINYTNFYHAKDTLTEMQNCIKQAIQECDVLIITGGISVGEYDFVKPALENAGVKELFYKVKQKPGKPLFVGTKKHQLIFALPGNPAAVISCFNQYVKPCLLQMKGEQNTFSNAVSIPLAHDWEKKSPLANILKAEVKNASVSILQGQDSFNLQAFSNANAFVVLYENDRFVKKGELVEVYYW